MHLHAVYKYPTLLKVSKTENLIFSVVMQRGSETFKSRAWLEVMWLWGPPQMGLMFFQESCWCLWFRLASNSCQLSCCSLLNAEITGKSMVPSYTNKNHFMLITETCPNPTSTTQHWKSLQKCLSRIRERGRQQGLGCTFGFLLCGSDPCPLCHLSYTP